ncbi:hypothetical protein Pmani_008747 [Petrolisthes manimaculis]|uniref:Uncharacterized protein n=1 Tax=Petrolisthes manimaculis TaxID=1843537 RepID=A0AAE1Q691_9EUCA|nr:hypothetical protein Pmani_008747 [Petrolisthes manimaculis]
MNAVSQSSHSSSSVTCIISSTCSFILHFFVQLFPVSTLRLHPLNIHLAFIHSTSTLPSFTQHPPCLYPLSVHLAFHTPDVHHRHPGHLL